MTSAMDDEKAMTTLVRNIGIISPDVKSSLPLQADILVRGGRIVAVGEDLAVTPGEPTDLIDGSSLLAMPGLVNAHYHSHDVLLKGSFDVMSLERWALRALPRFYPPRSDRELRLRTLIGAAECLRGGITTVQDMLSLWPLTRHQVDVVREAYQEAGIRVVLGIQAADTGPLDTVPYLREVTPPHAATLLNGPPPPAGIPDTIEEIEAILAAGKSASSALLTWAICPSSPERCSRPLLEKLRDVALRNNLRMFSHVAISRAEAVAAKHIFSAFGGSPIRYLQDLGMLGPQMTLAHGVWLDDADRDLVVQTGTRLVINPMSNLKTKNGIAPFRRYLEAGLHLGLGCDNCSCSDAQNMFQAMKFAVMVAGVTDHSEGGPTAADAFAAATIGGADALGLEGEIGRIAPGYRADITFLDRTDPVFQPLNDARRQIVYGESGRGVVSVMVEGKFVVRERRPMTIDPDALALELAELMPAFRRDAEEVLRRVDSLDPYILAANAKALRDDVSISRFACN
jgi:cytosine/adenosine deaminase-related metal-dependent hydrolase